MTTTIAVGSQLQRLRIAGGAPPTTVPVQPSANTIAPLTGGIVHAVIRASGTTELWNSESYISGDRTITSGLDIGIFFYDDENNYRDYYLQLSRTAGSTVSMLDAFASGGVAHDKSIYVVNREDASYQEVVYGKYRADRSSAEVADYFITGDAEGDFLVGFLDELTVNTSLVEFIIADAGQTPALIVIPAKPTGLSISRSGLVLTLDWKDPNNASITRYQFRERSRPSGGSFTPFSDWADIPNSDASTTSYDHTRDSIVSGTRYRYQIRAINNAGTGPQSGSADYDF